MRRFEKFLIAAVIAWAIAFVLVCVLRIGEARAETTSVAMVPKSQLDALQKRFDALEDQMRRDPRCIRMWTNAPRSI